MSTLPLIIDSQMKDLGGFSVRRILPYAKRRMVGPWIFFDHLGPVTFDAGQGINVRPHPHINLATVTYLFDGEILHRDSLGSHQLIKAGDLNLMVAGSGITHSERERDEVRDVPHTVHALQLWHALPEEHEECDPAFYHYAADALPQLEKDGVQIRVMMGAAYGVTSPVKTFAQTLYVEARMQQGQALILPDVQEQAIYVVHGKLTLNDTIINAQQMMVIDGEISSPVHAEEDTLLAIIGGAPLGERFVEWNFVSSRKERIAKAKEDWAAGRFPKVSDDEEDYIPLPE